MHIKSGRIVGIVLLSLCGLSGCWATAGRPLTGGRQEPQVFKSGGVPRRYVLYVPRAETRPRPLLLMLHGHGDSIRSLQDQTAMDAAADAGNFLVAYPLGAGWADLPPRSWNAGNCCGYAQQRGTDDVAFLRAVVEDISRRYAVDRARVYAAGLSNGAMMAHRLACEAADDFTAVAAVAGTLGLASCAPSRPIAVLAIHGTDDRLVPYEGGQPRRSGVPPRIDWPVASVMADWAAWDDCHATAQEQLAPGVRSVTYTGCAGHATVRLCTLEGGRHAWPQGRFSATAEVLKFFHLDKGNE